MSIVPADKLALAKALLNYKVFNAEQIDVHLTTDGRAAMLTIVNQAQGFEVTLPRSALKGLQNRISKALDD
jgi:hypothetical protein